MHVRSRVSARALALSSLVGLAGPALLLGGLPGCPGDTPGDGDGDGDGDGNGFDTVAFPDGFVWGTAVAQWQVAGDQSATGGDPVESNWSRWMGLGKADADQVNTDGNGFVTHYEEDLDRAVDLGLTVFRMSIDWSRIEPVRDEFDQGELDHVVDVLTAARARGLEPVITFWHWVVPVWVQNPDGSQPPGYVDLLADPGREIVDEFEAFVRFVVPAIKDKVDTYTVLNEPFSILSAGYLDSQFPPGLFLNVPAATQAGINLLFMQARAYDAIKELDDVDMDGRDGASWVGFTQTANLFYPVTPGDPQEALAVESVSYVFNDWPMIAITRGDLDVNLDGDITDLDTSPPEGNYPEVAGRADFIGVQYYGPVYLQKDPNGILDNFHPIYALPRIDVADVDETLPHNGMGREIRARGFRETIDHYAQWELPIVLTENGTTTNLQPEKDEDTGELLAPLEFNDAQAAMYLVEHLWEVGKAIEDGVDIRGYYHWTLADNFEWVEGRHQRFGAYRVDFETAGYPRTLTPMGEALQQVVAAGAIDETLWNTWVLERYPSDQRETGGLTGTLGD